MNVSQSPSLSAPRDRFTIASQVRQAAVNQDGFGNYAEADRLWALYDRIRAQLVATDLASYKLSR